MLMAMIVVSTLLAAQPPVPSGASPNPPPATNVTAPPVTTGAQQPSNSGSTADWFMVWLTAVMAVATIVLVGVAIHQFRTQSRETAEALRLTRESNAAAAADRERAVEQNQKLVAATELSVFLAQRPRVGVTHIRIRDVGPNRVLEGEACARNWAGKPAKPHRYTMALHVGPLPEAPHYGPWFDADELLVVGDGRKLYTVTFDRQITPDEWEKIQTDQLELFFYGRFDYESLGNSFYTGFCTRYYLGGDFKRIYAPSYNEET